MLHVLSGINVKLARGGQAFNDIYSWDRNMGLSVLESLQHASVYTGQLKHKTTAPPRIHWETHESPIFPKELPLMLWIDFNDALSFHV